MQMFQRFISSCYHCQSFIPVNFTSSDTICNLIVKTIQFSRHVSVNLRSKMYKTARYRPSSALAYSEAKGQ